MPSERYDYYLEQCKIHHATKKTFSGNGVLKHARALVEFSKRIGAVSAIDYGCGKGLQYGRAVIAPLQPVDAPPADSVQLLTLEQALGYGVYKYDPAVPMFSAPPLSRADFVWCTDVLEHIPEEDIPFIVSELSRLAIKGVFVTVGTYPAKKHLPNGENAHVCVKPTEWWVEKFADLQARHDLATAEDPFEFQMLCE